MALRRGGAWLDPARTDPVVPWSRIFDAAEILLAINTDVASPRSVWVTVDDGLHRVGETLRSLYSTDADQIGPIVRSSRAMAKRSCGQCLQPGSSSSNRRCDAAGSQAASGPSR